MYYWHYYETEAEFQAAYNGTDYFEPWLSYTNEAERSNYNKRPEEMYLTFSITNAGNITWKAGSSNGTKTAYYRKNGGEWTSITSTTSGVNIPVAVGDVVEFKGGNDSYGIVTEDWPFSGGTSFKGSTCKFNLSGNIMSLIGGDNFRELTSFPSGSKNTFAHMFSGCGVQDASMLSLPVMELVDCCYVNMFQNCTSLTVPPELPATTLAVNAYYYMFDGCSSLNTFQPVLPAINIVPYCYEGMFRGCSSLQTPPEINGMNTAKYCYKLMFSQSGIRTAPSILRGDVVCYAACYEMFKGCWWLQNAPVLPATEIHGSGYIHMFEDCGGLKNAPELPFTLLTYGPDDMGEKTTGITQCHSMFKNCTSLETAPEILPATSVTNNCYTNMFQGCTKLTTAPILPAKSLAGHGNCYGAMFSGCTLLNYIKCLATDLGTPSESLRTWVDGVAASGTFVKDPSMSSWSTGVDGIPNGWTVLDKAYGFNPDGMGVPSSAGTRTTKLELLWYELVNFFGLDGDWYTGTTSEAPDGGYILTIEYSENTTSSIRSAPIGATVRNPDTQETLFTYFTFQQSSGS